MTSVLGGGLSILNRYLCLGLTLLLTFTVAWGAPLTAQDCSTQANKKLRVAYREKSETALENLKGAYRPGFKALIKDEARTRTDFSQGIVIRTESNTDLAIHGLGFFVFQDSKNHEFGRDGRFAFQQGILTNTKGAEIMGYALDEQANQNGPLSPISLNQGPGSKFNEFLYSSYRFDELGKLYGLAEITDPTSGLQIEIATPLFQVAMARFPNPSGLSRSSEGTFQASLESGNIYLGVAETMGRGSVVPGALELSNIDYRNENEQLNSIIFIPQLRRRGLITLHGPLEPETEKRLRAEGLHLERSGSRITLRGRNFIDLARALARVDSQLKDGALNRDALHSLLYFFEPTLIETDH